MLDDDDGNAEERCRRIQAEQEAKNIGAVIGLATGVAMALVQDKPSAEKSQIEETQQQTMG